LRHLPDPLLEYPGDIVLKRRFHPAPFFLLTPGKTELP
jgi:hypothetical protein